MIDPQRDGRAIERAVSLVERLVARNARHRAGFRLNALATSAIAEHLLLEATELRDAPTDISEAADVLGVCFTSPAETAGRSLNLSPK